MAFLDEDFEVGEQIQTVTNGAGATADSPRPPLASKPPCGLACISQMLADPEVPITNISRAIALEIAGVIGKMTEDRPLRQRRPRHELNDENKGLSRAAALSHRRRSPIYQKTSSIWTAPNSRSYLRRSSPSSSRH
jgi:hypothetical protein